MYPPWEVWVLPFRGPRGFRPPEPVTIPLPTGRVPVTAIPDRSVSAAVYATLALTSVEREALVLKLDDDAFQAYAAHILQHCAVYRRPTVVYDHTAIAVVLPELLARWQAARAD